MDPYFFSLKTNKSVTGYVDSAKKLIDLFGEFSKEYLNDTEGTSYYYEKVDKYRDKVSEITDLEFD